jgi:hypothetical protein
MRRVRHRLCDTNVRIPPLGTAVTEAGRDDDHVAAAGPFARASGLLEGLAGVHLAVKGQRGEPLAGVAAADLSVGCDREVALGAGGGVPVGLVGHHRGEHRLPIPVGVVQGPVAGRQHRAVRGVLLLAAAVGGALDFMDCSSLSIFLRVQRLARQSGGDMVLAAPQRQPRRLLALTGQSHTFCVHPTVQAAVATTAARCPPTVGAGYCALP